MLYASATSKDGNLGTIIIGEDQDSILDECIRWMYQNKLKPDDLNESKLYNRETGEVIGLLEFTLV